MTFQCKELSSVGLYFGTPEAPCLTTVPIKSAGFSVTSLHKDLDEGQANNVRLPKCEAYFLMLYLEDARHADVRADGSSTPVRDYSRGSICLVDLEDGVSICLHGPLRSLAFVLPKALFDEAASLSPGMTARRLACRRGKPDSVLCNLGTALLALLGNGAEPSPPALLRHVAVAICAHLLHQYGETGAGDALSRRQEAAAKDFMRDNLDNEPSLASIAAAAGLAPEHLLVQFQRATGLTPHQWLAGTRVDQAKGLLSAHTLTLEDVAGRCGFADLDQFVALFAAETGLTPAAWSRKRLN